jgi:hypothetical protein
MPLQPMPSPGSSVRTEFALLRRLVIARRLELQREPDGMIILPSKLGRAIHLTPCEKRAAKERDRIIESDLEARRHG